MAKKTQVWWCEGCLEAGSVDLEDHAGVIEAVGEIQASHKEVSPSCLNNHPRVLNLDLILNKVLPLWAAKKIPSLLLDVP